MKKMLLATLCLCASSLISSVSYADGLSLSGTRLIYDANKKEASLNLNSSANTVPHLVQSWVSDNDLQRDNIPFITTPPLAKLATNSSVPIRVVNVGALPTDRESLFLLHVRAVPATERVDNPQRMTIAIQNTVKLIYRPAGLTSRDAEQAVEKLTVAATAAGVKFDNPTPYVVSLANMTINGTQVEHSGVVKPFASSTVPFNAGKAREVSFNAINDFGGTTPRRVLTL